MTAVLIKSNLSPMVVC